MVIENQAEIEIQKLMAQITELADCYQNSQPIRERMRSISTNVLDKLKNERSINYYELMCDDRNNPPEMEDNNQFRWLLIVKHTPSISSTKLYGIGYTEAEFQRMSPMK